jgi:hypothetical protein
MIVHLIGSLRDFEQDSKYISTIIETIHDKGGVLAHGWLEAALTRKREEMYIADWTPFVENDIRSVKRADVVIVELTHYAFSQGYQIAAALEYKKPILALTRDSIKGKSASGITNPLFTHKQYSNTSELQSLTRAFIEKNTIYTKDLRFNILLTRNILKYLETTTKETGSNRSEIIRNLINRKTKRRGNSND